MAGKILCSRCSHRKFRFSIFWVSPAPRNAMSYWGRGTSHRGNPSLKKVLIGLTATWGRCVKLAYVSGFLDIFKVPRPLSPITRRDAHLEVIEQPTSASELSANRKLSNFAAAKQFTREPDFSNSALMDLTLSVTYISRALNNSARLSPKASYMLCRPTFMTPISSSADVAAKPC